MNGTSNPASSHSLSCMMCIFGLDVESGEMTLLKGRSLSEEHSTNTRTRTEHRL